MKVLLGISLLLVLSGCMGSGIKTTANDVVAFDPKEVAYINEQGTAKIEGQAQTSYEFRERGKQILTCAGEVVTLLPAGLYPTLSMKHIDESRERILSLSVLDLVFDTSFVSDTADARYRSLVRETTCDASGNFTFDNVADGEYYLNTTICHPDAPLWRTPLWHATQGGLYITKRITVTEGQSQKINLFPYHRSGPRAYKGC